MQAINLEQKFSLFSECWSPKVIAELNGQAVKLAKVAGEFVWHDHAEEDELFLVVRGSLILDFQESPSVTLRPGELCVVPRGTQHRPRTVDGKEAWILLLEPISIRHTGAVNHALTVTSYDRL